MARKDPRRGLGARDTAGAPPGGVAEALAPAAACPAAGTVHVAATAADGTVWLTRREPQGAWRGWASLGDRTPAAPAVASWGPDGVFVVVVADDLQPAYRGWTPDGGWGDWTPGPPLPGGLAPGTSIAAVCPAPGELRLEARAAAGQRLVHASWTSATGWTAWDAV